MPNIIADFPPDRFAIVAFCHECDHWADIDLGVLPQEMTMGALRSRLRCRQCGGREVSVRIVWTAAGGFTHSLGSTAFSGTG